MSIIVVTNGINLCYYAETAQYSDIYNDLLIEKQAALKSLAQAALDIVLKTLPEGIVIVDSDFNIRYANNGFCRIFGEEYRSITEKRLSVFLENPRILEEWFRLAQTERYREEEKEKFLKNDGTRFKPKKYIQALFDKNNNVAFLVIIFDDFNTIADLSNTYLRSKELLKSYISDLEVMVDEQSKALIFQRHFDPLTELPNRLQLLLDIESLHEPHVLILFNVDRFNEINTFYGHRIGDKLLHEIGMFLSSVSDHFKSAQVYKLPVDEYAILVQQPYCDKEITIFIHILFQKILNKVFYIDYQEIQISATLGIAYSTDTTDAHSLPEFATMALKLAKREGKSHQFYDPDFHIKEDYEHNLTWIKKLRQAIDEDRVLPYYQPIVDSESGKVEKFEALVRIVERDGSVIPPSKFLDIAKKVRLYHRITMIVVRKVFAMLEEHSDISCSINLSIEDINNEQIFKFLIDTVRNSTCSKRIIFEITESEGIDNYDLVHDFIRQVKQYGVKIALDDFGAGYSNFAYIIKLDIDFIKIDGSIIRDIDTNRVSQIIVQTLIDFADQLGIETIAEFVGTQSIYEYLKSFSLTYMQGYLFGEPKSSF